VEANLSGSITCYDERLLRRHQ